MVRRRVTVSVLQRSDIAAANVLRFAASLRNYGIKGRLPCQGEYDQLVDRRGEQPDMKTSWCILPLFYSAKAVGPLEFDG